MERLEPLDKEFYEERDTIEDIDQTSNELIVQHIIKNLDEIAEFNKKALDALRQPMEDQKVTISRVKYTNTYPANFMLVAAMNPCTCGYYGTDRCRCSDYEVIKYRQKISGPILDRMDIQKYVQPVDFAQLSGRVPGISSKDLRERVQLARDIQKVRYASIENINCNAQMTPALIKERGVSA